MVKWLARSGVTANQVTLAAVVLSFGAGLWLAIDRGTGATLPGLVDSESIPRILLMIPVVLFVRMALNAIDGMLAREHDMKSRLGAVLNEMGDVVSDVALYLPLVWIVGFDERAVILLVILGIIVEMSGVVSVQIGSSRRYDGPMGKSDRAFVLGALCLLLGLGVPAGEWVSYLLWGIVVLEGVTVFQRSRKGLAECN
ncbi:MAG: CDP-alcohol phosphatidyltransferase family protein [Planctomycetia bacterium]|nr:CDP-alcohol phosphatidyltransferase family protein [Planctomycetia bacterium]NCG13139.1 CDP-alcohol phosphatidyltransferase family protein [Planctomycetia bacterium]NCG56218.1 CDP-alcohol phosphatidyltransferase family protein [Pseudomonadota bacterium]